MKIIVKTLAHVTQMCYLYFIKQTNNKRPTKMSEIMTAMLRIVEGGMNETNDAVELVDEVVALMGYEKKIVARDAYELNQENMRKNLPSSLR